MNGFWRLVCAREKARMPRPVAGEEWPVGGSGAAAAKGSSLKRWRKRAEAGERGQAMVWFIVSLPLLLMLIVLVVDGGQMYLEYLRARSAAELAAQAGAQSVDEEVFRGTNEVMLNIDGSLWAMHQYMTLNSAGRQGRISTHYYGHTAYAQVCTQTEVPTLFFRLFGADTLPVGACARAYPAHGIRREGE